MKSSPSPSKRQSKSRSKISMNSPTSPMHQLSGQKTRQEMIDNYNSLVEQYNQELEEKKRIENEVHEVMLKIASIAKQDSRIDELLAEIHQKPVKRSRTASFLKNTKK